MSKVILFANTDWYLYNFRLALAKQTRRNGNEVLMASPHGKHVSLIEDAGFRWAPIELGGGSKGLANLSAFRQLDRLYRQERPDLVHHFTIKCVLLGGCSARRLGIPRVNAITGLGHVFTDDRLSNRVLRRAIGGGYRYACGGKQVASIFQNEEDQSFFQKRQLVDSSSSYLIRGSGADTDRLRPGNPNHAEGPCRFLFASRLIREKGIDELMTACKLLRDRGCKFELQIAGDIYPANPSSLTAQEAQRLSEHATMLGHVNEMEPIIQQADVVVLPSYREGTPRILLEGGACGKPLIATDIAGCRGVVQPNHNGFLVPCQNSTELADAMQALADSPSMRLRYGQASRQIIERDFSEKSVVSRTLSIYSQLGFDRNNRFKRRQSRAKFNPS